MSAITILRLSSVMVLMLRIRACRWEEEFYSCQSKGDLPLL